MFHWKGAAGVCINEENQVLFVLQASEEDVAKWSVPSGGLEGTESFEDCCVREFEEETGLKVEVTSTLHTKSGVNKQYGISYELHYFRVKVLSGELILQDPDESVLAIEWKSMKDLQQGNMSYPEDLEFLLDLMDGNS